MGIDIRPGRAQWSYSGFMAFREALAEAEGLVLREMAGFTEDGRPWERSNHGWVTPLAPLLNHSDCDGYLDPDECEEVLPRLTQILDEWQRDKSRPIERHYDLAQGRELVEAMQHCIEHRCAVRFT